MQWNDCYSERGEAEENVGPAGCYSNAGVQCTGVRANSIYHIFKLWLKKDRLPLFEAFSDAIWSARSLQQSIEPIFI